MKVTRPPAEPRKIHSKNEFELCYMRHQYFRRVDYNPTAEEMKPYMGIIKSLTTHTFYVYRYLFSTVGLEREDIISIGRINLVNFLGLFEFDEKRNRNKYEEFCVHYMNKHNDQMPDLSAIADKNKANLTMFMKQRMEDLVRICRQKAKNIKGLQVDEYIPFYGPNPPPTELYKLLKDNDKYGFKRLDNVAFNAVKRKTKADIKKPFQFAGSWYVAVPMEQRSLTVLDFEGAGLDPYESQHNKDPEKILQEKEKEITFDKNMKMFKNSPKEEKVKTIFDFIEKNEDDPFFEEEIVIAKRFLKNMGMEYVRQSIER
jgi:hypothetical protein